MLARLDKVLEQKPDWVTLSCGVNDTWISLRRSRDQMHMVVPVEEFARNVTTFVDRCEAAGARVILLTPTLIGERIEGPDVEFMTPYLDWMRSFAAKRGIPLADLNALMTEAVQIDPIPGIAWRFRVTVDGVHMNPRGNRIMARGVLRTIGLTDPEITALHERWLDIPDGQVASPSIRQIVLDEAGNRIVYDFGARTAVTPREYIYLEAMKRTVHQFSIPKEQVLNKLLREHGGPFEDVRAIREHPDFERIRQKAQKDTDRLLAESIAEAKTFYEKHVNRLPREERRAMETNLFR